MRVAIGGRFYIFCFFFSFFAAMRNDGSNLLCLRSNQLCVEKKKKRKSSVFGLYSPFLTGGGLTYVGSLVQVCSESTKLQKPSVSERKYKALFYCASFYFVGASYVHFVLNFLTVS